MGKEEAGEEEEVEEVQRGDRKLEHQCHHCAEQAIMH